MRKANAQLNKPGAVEAIAVERRTAAPVVAHKPNKLAEARADPARRGSTKAAR